VCNRILKSEGPPSTSSIRRRQSKDVPGSVQLSGGSGLFPPVIRWFNGSSVCWHESCQISN
jgi:hypothetical protein